MKLPRIARFEIFQGMDEQWYWRLRGANNEVMASSEGYVSKGNAERGAKAARAAARFALLKDV